MATTNLATTDPLSSCQIHFLNLILLNGKTTIILWLLPLESAASVMHIRHF